MELRNINDYDSFKNNQLTENIHNIPTIVDEVWQQDEYYSTSYEMGYYELIQIEVKERGNYSMEDIKEWMKMYRLTKNDTFRWVAKTPAMAARYDMSADLWNGDLYIKEYKKNPNEYHVEVVRASSGVVITESDDGDWGAIMVIKDGNEKAFCLWNYMKYKLEEIGGVFNTPDLANSIDLKFSLKELENLIINPDQTFAIISNFKHLGGVPTGNTPVHGGLTIENMVHKFLGLGMFIVREISKTGVDFKLVPQYGTYQYNEDTSYIPELSWLVYSDSKYIIEIIADIAQTKDISQESIIIKDGNEFGLYYISPGKFGLSELMVDIQFEMRPGVSNLNIGDVTGFGFSKLMLKNGKMDNSVHNGVYSFISISKNEEK